MKKSFLLITAVILLLIALLSPLFYRQHKPFVPASPPPASPFTHAIGGVGTIEPASEDINIGSQLSGIINAVYITAGQHIKQGQPLFALDSREYRAKLNLVKAQLQSTKVQLANANYELSLYNSISDKRAISGQELNKYKYAAQLWKSRVDEAQANVNLVQTNLDRLTVFSPIDGVILKVNIRVGEYAMAGVLTNPLVVLGNLDSLHVRVEIDEANAAQISPTSKAVGILRGKPGKYISLRFVRLEPLMIPKKALNGGPNEVVDTRVLEVIYGFNNGNLGAYAGQEMDVFITANPSDHSPS